MPVITTFLIPPLALSALEEFLREVAKFHKPEDLIPPFLPVRLRRKAGNHYLSYSSFPKGGGEPREPEDFCPLRTH